jgi:hypothetical protein
VVTNTILKLAELICHKVESTNNTVCPGAVHEMGIIILPVLTNFTLSPDYMCNKVKPLCNEIEYKELNDTEFVERILSDKPDIIKNNDF